MIALETRGALWRVVIDRPDKANSLTAEMLGELARIAEDAHGQAQVLVLTGRGRVFSAGADLEAARAGLAKDPVWERLSGALASFEGLSIAALNGTLAGGAFGMALACDLRIAVEGAKFFYPAISLGFLPQPSDPPRLAALVGPARAKMILMAGQKIPAEEALAWGLIDRLVAPDALEATVAELSEAALAAPAERVAAIKALIAGRD
ncbi:MAG: enoyl-CoA hydratase/isomerase family protein [Pseudomonadota bacterium]